MDSTLLTLIYPYRNRDLNRLKISFDSLKKQSNLEFEVYLVDYGSEKEKAEASKNLCKKYEFVIYRYLPTQFQPWNKSRALNSVIKHLKSEFCFVADVDMIFHPQFIEKAIKLQTINKTVYFQVGFLEPDKVLEKKDFGDYINYRKSTSEATGLSMFPVKVLRELRGFDEFYHFWGAEDTDMHVRIENAGYEVFFYNYEVLMLHQWHDSYRNSESGKLGKELQINGIVQLNHLRLKHAIQFSTTKANLENWGECNTKEDFNQLEKAPINFVFDNEQRKIDHLVFGLMPTAKNEILKIKIKKDPFQNSLRIRTKRLLRIKVPKYYSLKEINDKVLLHLISFYRNKAYTFKISDDFESIEIAVKF